MLGNDQNAILTSGFQLLISFIRPLSRKTRSIEAWYRRILHLWCKSVTTVIRHTKRAPLVQSHLRAPLVPRSNRYRRETAVPPLQVADQEVPPNGLTVRVCEWRCWRIALEASSIFAFRWKRNGTAGVRHQDDWLSGGLVYVTLGLVSFVLQDDKVDEGVFRKLRRV